METLNPIQKAEGLGTKLTLHTCHIIYIYDLYPTYNLSCDCHVTLVAGLPIEEILGYLVQLELSGEVFGEGLLLPLFSELSATELEEQLEEDQGLATLIM